MQYERKSNKNKKSSTERLVVKSAVWTLAALSLMAIGYFGADMLFG